MNVYVCKIFADTPLKELWKTWFNQKYPETRIRTLVFRESDLECDSWLKLSDILKEIYWRFWFL